MKACRRVPPSGLGGQRGFVEGPGWLPGLFLFIRGWLDPYRVTRWLELCLWRFVAASLLTAPPFPGRPENA